MKTTIKKFLIILTIFSILLNNFIFARVDPFGVEGSPPIYEDPGYSIFLKDLHSWIEDLLNISTTPPEEGVPVFLYDPILYSILRYGFNLQSGSSLKINETILKNYLQEVSNLTDENLKNSIYLYEIVGLSAEKERLRGLEEILRRLITKWEKSRRAYNQIVNFPNYYPQCLDPEFVSYHLNVLNTLEETYRLKSFSDRIANNLEICSSPSGSYAYKAPQPRLGLLGKIVSAFSGRFFLAQTTEIPEQELPTAIVLPNGLDYTLRDFNNSYYLRNFGDDTISLLTTPPAGIPNQPFSVTEITCVIKNDDGKFIPCGFEISPTIGFMGNSSNYLINPATLSKLASELPLKGFSDTNGPETIVFDLFIKNDFLKKIFKSEEGKLTADSILTEIHNYCADQKVLKIDYLNIRRSSAYSSCVHKNVERFISDFNLLTKSIALIVDNLKFFDNEISKVIGHARNYLPQDEIELMELIGYFEAVHKRVSSLTDNDEIKNLKPINYNNIKYPSGCSPTSCTIYGYYGNSFNNFVIPKIKSAKNVIEILAKQKTSVLGLAEVYNKIRFLNSLASIYEKCKGNNCPVTLVTADSLPTKKTFYVKKQKVIVKKNYPFNFNLLSLITNIFKPKEVNIIKSK